MATINLAGATSGTTSLIPTAIAGTGTLTLPTGTDTLVGKATTDTLTNKTLVAPALGTPASGDLANCTGYPSPVATPVVATYATNADLTTYIPGDNTIPQVSEGTQIISQSFTATSASHRIRVRFVGQVASVTSPDQVCAALFIDGAANAVAAAWVTTSAAAYMLDIVFEYEAAQSAGAHTYTVRVGGNGTTVRMNGTGAGRIGGGVQVATLVIEEVNAP